MTDQCEYHEGICDTKEYRKGNSVVQEHHVEPKYVRFNALFEQFLDNLSHAFVNSGILKKLKNAYTVAIEFSPTLPMQKYVGIITPIRTQIEEGDESVMDTPNVRNSMIGNLGELWHVATPQTKKAIQKYFKKLNDIAFS